MLIRTSNMLILNKAGKLSIKVIIVLFRARFVLKKKNMRTILKDLITVVYGPIEELFDPEFMIAPNIVIIKISISKVFQLS